MLYPTLYTPPLSPFVSDGPMLRQFMALTMKDANGQPLVLDDWQSWLLDSVLERFPSNYPNPELAGRLRYRQVLISVCRQSGKSLLGCALGLYGLLLKEQHYAYVIGVASSREQSQIVYQRVLQTINTNPALKRRFARLTDTRGISSPDGQKRYELKASKAAAVQGLPITTGIADELHIMKVNIWDAMVLGTTTFADGIVIGITTAGDENSICLKGLYERTEEPYDPETRFGFFIWEAPSDDLTEANVLASNPAVVCGRIPLKTVMSDIKNMPPSEAIRYRLNRFVASSNPWIEAGIWKLAETAHVANPEYVCIDRSPKWSYASLTTAERRNGKTYTTARWAKASPTEDDLFNESKRFWGAKFVVDGYSLKNLAARLRAEGQRVTVTTRSDVFSACQLAYADLANNRLLHTTNPYLDQQALTAQKRSEGEAWRIVSNGESLDLVMGMILANWLCSTDNEDTLMLY